MKVCGKTLSVTNQKVVTFKRKSADGQNEELISLVVSPNQLSFQQKYLPTGVLSLPKIPVELVRDKKTNRVEVDEKGEVVKINNTNDPDFIRKWRNATDRSAAVQFRDALRLDPNVEWESQEPGFEPQDKETEEAFRKRWSKYADALCQEIESAGFTDGEITHVIHVSSELEVSTDDEKVISDF